MSTPTIIAIQAPPGTDLRPTLPYLERSAKVEFRVPSVIYLDASADVSAKRLHKKLCLLRGMVESLLNIHVRIGAGSSKTVALVAARQASPGGITIVPPGDEAAFFERVVIDLLPGIGRRTAAYLRRRGVTTIGKFARLPQTAAIQLFGISGIVLREFSKGADPREVLPHEHKRRPLTGRRSLLSLFSSGGPYSTLGVVTGASSR